MNTLFNNILKIRKGAIRNRKSENDRQKKKNKNKNNDLQNTTQKTPLKIRIELVCSGRVSCSTTAPP